MLENSWINRVFLRTTAFLLDGVVVVSVGAAFLLPSGVGRTTAVCWSAVELLLLLVWHLVNFSLIPGNASNQPVSSHALYQATRTTQTLV